MQKLAVLLFLTLLSVFVKSQTIYSALQLNAEREYKTQKPKKIEETSTFLKSNSKQVNKTIKIFDLAGMLLVEDRFDDGGNLKAKLTYTNDTTHRLILSRIFEKWTTAGYSKDIAFYTYDKNFFLVGITEKDANGKIFQQTNITCNDKGHPVELILYDRNGNPYGREFAKYLYDKNKVVTTVVANDGVIISSDTAKISFINAGKFQSVNETYNVNGDPISWISRNFNGSETIFEAEYAYDSFGNCVESKIFKVTVKANGKRNRENDRIFRRNYDY